jgi:hypothetical protein
MAGLDGEALQRRLPRVAGRLEPNAPLAEFTWFRTGGPAEVLFTPADEADLAAFLAGTPRDVPVDLERVGLSVVNLSERYPRHHRRGSPHERRGLWRRDQGRAGGGAGGGQIGDLQLSNAGMKYSWALRFLI